MTLEKAEQAINDYYGDTSRPIEETQMGLQHLQELLDILIDAAR